MSKQKAATGFEKSRIEQRLSFMKNKWYVLLAISVLCFILYGNTIRNKYSLDDAFVIQQEQAEVTGFKALPKIFTSLYVTENKQTYGYRPIVKATFAIEHQFTKGNPHVSHFVNVLLYILCCFLLFIVLKKVFPNFSDLFFVVFLLLFICHPIHTEVVASLKNRDEMLCFLFAFMASWLSLKFVETSKIWLIPLVLVFYIAGYLSKFSVIMFIALIPLLLAFRDKPNFWKVALIFVLLIAVTVGLRYYLNKSLPAGFRPKLFYENPLIFERSLINRVPTGMIILLFYLGKLIFPHPLISYYGYDMIMIAGWSDWQVYLSILIHLALLVLAIWKIRKHRLLSFSILFYFVSIAMYTSVLRPVMGIVAERFLFIPSIAFSMALAYIVFLLFRFGIVKIQTVRLSSRFTVLMILILLPYSVKTIDRNKDWYDLNTLLENDVKHGWNSVKLNSLYAGELIEQILVDVDQGNNLQTVEERARIAEKHLLRTTELFQKDFTAWNNLGTLSFTIQKDYQKAIGYFQRALRSNPFNAHEPYYNIGVCYTKLENYELALKAHEEAIMIKSDFPDPYRAITEIRLIQGDTHKALQSAQIMIDQFPDLDNAYLLKGKIYLDLADTLAAVDMFEKALVADPSNHELSFSLKDYFESTGNMEKAAFYHDLGNRYVVKTKKRGRR